MERIKDSLSSMAFVMHVESSVIKESSKDLSAFISEGICNLWHNAVQSMQVVSWGLLLNKCRSC